MKSVVRKVKLGDLELVSEVIRRIANSRLPVRAAYWISRSLKPINDELAGLANLKNDLAQKYGEKDENGKLILSEDKRGVKLAPATVEEYWKELKELFETETEIMIHPLSLDMLANVEITPFEMQAILFLLEEEEVEGTSRLDN